MKSKTCSKLANGLNLYDLKKKLTPEVALTLPWGYIHVYYHSSQTSNFVGIYLRSQVSVYRTIGPLVHLKIQNDKRHLIYEMRHEKLVDCLCENKVTAQQISDFVFATLIVQS